MVLRLLLKLCAPVSTKPSTAYWLLEQHQRRGVIHVCNQVHFRPPLPGQTRGLHGRIFDPDRYHNRRHRWISRHYCDQGLRCFRRIGRPCVVDGAGSAAQSLRHSIFSYFFSARIGATYICGRKVRGSDSERALPRGRCQPSNLYLSSATVMRLIVCAQVPARFLSLGPRRRVDGKPRQQRQ